MTMEFIISKTDSRELMHFMLLFCGAHAIRPQDHW